MTRICLKNHATEQEYWNWNYCLKLCTLYTLFEHYFKSGIKKCEIVRDAIVYVNYFLQIFMSIAMLVSLGQNMYLVSGSKNFRIIKLLSCLATSNLAMMTIFTFLPMYFFFSVKPHLMSKYSSPHIASHCCCGGHSVLKIYLKLNLNLYPSATPWSSVHLYLYTGCIALSHKCSKQHLHILRMFIINNFVKLLKSHYSKHFF